MAGNIEVLEAQKYHLPKEFSNGRRCRNENLSQKPPVTAKPSLSTSSVSTENVQQIVVEAVKRIGGIEKVTPETLLDELMNHEGLNLLDVDKHIQILKRPTNSKGNIITFVSHTMNKKSSKLKAGSRALVKDKIMAKTIDMALSKDEVANLLESEEKMWRFCTLYPQNYEFEKDSLIQQWIAVGFLKGEHKDQLGDFYFSTLLDNDYIMSTSKCSPVEKEKYKVNTKKMKDDNDASTMSHNKEQLYLTLNKLHYCHIQMNKEARYVSLVGDGINKANLKKLKDFKDLKMLVLLSENVSSISKVPHNVFSGLKHLKVLDMSRTSLVELPNSIGELIVLKYLDLSHTLIEVLPETLDCLSKLQTLKLKDCRNLSRLPEEMRKLTSLKHLELDVLEQLDFMPRGMGALIELETLQAYLVHKDDGCSIKELKNMNNLKGSFCISKLENVLSPLDVDEAALSKKICITELELRWSDLHQPWNKPQEQVKVLHNLCPNSNLEKLQISCYGGFGFPSWIGDPTLNKLTSVTLFKCNNSEVLPSLGKLPSLKYLSLVEMSSVIEIGIKFRGYNSSIAFPKLERLAIVGFLKLKRWKDVEKWDYPRLIKLTIERCPELVVPSSLKLYSLKHLEIINCGKLMFSSFEKILSNSVLMNLIIEGCPLITEWLQKRKGKNLHKIQHVQNVWIDHELVIGN